MPAFLQRIRNTTLLAMQHCNSQRDSVCLSLCLSITFECCVQTNEDTNMRFSVSGRTIPLVSRVVKFFRNWQEITPSGAVKERHFHFNSENLTNNRP